jgi:hypothetical protein
VPLRKRFLSFPLRFQECGLKTNRPPTKLAQNIPLVVVELNPELFLLARGNTTFLEKPKLGSKNILTDS